MKFLLDTTNSTFPLCDKLGKLNSIFADCNTWESYKDTDEIVKEIEDWARKVGKETKSINDLVMRIDNKEIWLEHTTLKGEVGKVGFDSDGIWVDCFLDDGNEYFVSFLFEWTNEPVVAYRY